MKRIRAQRCGTGEWPSTARKAESLEAFLGWVYASRDARFSFRMVSRLGEIPGSCLICSERLGLVAFLKNRRTELHFNPGLRWIGAP